MKGTEVGYGERMTGEVRLHVGKAPHSSALVLPAASFDRLLLPRRRWALRKSVIRDQSGSRSSGDLAKI